MRREGGRSTCWSRRQSRSTRFIAQQLLRTNQLAGARDSSRERRTGAERGSTHNGQVVRVGDEVHRPRTQGAELVESFLLHLELVGFDASPRFLGIDESGRQVLTFVEGEVTIEPPGSTTTTPTDRTSSLSRGCSVVSTTPQRASSLHRDRRHVASARRRGPRGCTATCTTGTSCSARTTLLRWSTGTS